MRSAFRRRRRPSGAAARARQGSRLRQARGPGRAIPTGGARRPLRALAVSGGQRRAEPRSFPAQCPALRAAGPFARRALRRASRSWPSAPVPQGGRPVGAVRGPSPRRIGRGPDGPGRSRSPVRAGWSARGDPGPAGLLAAVCGGPVVRPERRAPGELPVRVHGCAGRSSAQRPLIRRQANRDHVGAPLPSGLRAVLGRTSRRGPGSRVVAAVSCPVVRASAFCAAARLTGSLLVLMRRSGGRALPAWQELVQD
jgi:hypothetical protein